MTFMFTTNILNNTVVEQEQINYFQIQLGDNYHILCKLGKSGARTSCFLVTDNYNCFYALRVSNNGDASWIKQQLQTIDITNYLFKDYAGNIDIPKTILIGEDYILETYAGEVFSNEACRALSQSKRQEIAEDVAFFLYHIHNKYYTSSITPLRMYGNSSLEEVLDLFSNYLSSSKVQYLRELINRFNTRDTSDEVAVITHSDLRYQNMLYNFYTSKLSIIDFELTSVKRNIYHDFVPFATASFGIDYEFWHNVISAYNQMSKKNGLCVDIEKVKLFHILGILHEYGRCAIYFNKDRLSVYKSLTMALKDIDEVINFL